MASETVRLTQRYSPYEITTNAPRASGHIRSRGGVSPPRALSQGWTYSPGRGSMRRKAFVLALALLATLTIAAPASGAGKTARGALPPVCVFAAASLSHVFPAMASAFKTAHPVYEDRKFSFNFQGTDMLVAQIQQGAPADVFAGASTKYGNLLFTGGLINVPANFCQN